MSFHLFVLALDWLFLIQIIESDEKGNIVICS
ncbi:ABC-three component system middle component 6 [Dehalobacter sp. DCM]